MKGQANQPSGVEVRPHVLFNPDTRSANFFLPGLMVVIAHMTRPPVHAGQIAVVSI